MRAPSQDSIPMLIRAVLSSVNESLYGVPNKLERMIETGEYHVSSIVPGLVDVIQVTMDSVCTALV